MELLAALHCVVGVVGTVTLPLSVCALFGLVEIILYKRLVVKVKLKSAERNECHFCLCLTADISFATVLTARTILHKSLTFV